MPKRIFLGGAVLVGVALYISRQPVVSGESTPEAAQAGAKQPTTLYFGVALCRKCHNEKQAVPDKDALLYRGIEMSTWDQSDKHKDATVVLKNERSQQIGKLLGWPDVRNDRRCLSCHGVVVANEKEVHEASFSPAQREESGVSCVVCHGAAKEWVDNHATVTGGDAWKKLTRAEKQRDHGLRDMWDPAVRAALCCSCHIGNVAEGKVVTHEMYAAGHPPLPGIEVLSFSDAMPRHWENLSEKIAKRPQHKEFHKRVHGYDSDQADVEAARFLAVSAAVAFRSSMQLVHDLAGADAAKPDAKESVWPELAVFDCGACHHDLKSDAWRQQRPTGGRPGRPVLRSWPSQLLEMNLQHLSRRGDAALAAEYRRQADELKAALDQTPFGPAPAVAARASSLVQWSEQCLQALQAPANKFERSAARDMLLSLLRRPEKELLDFDSARQNVWGARALLPALIPAWHERVDLTKPLAALQVQLQLDLPKGQVSITKEFLPLVLKSMAAYDPRATRQLMVNLASAIDKEGR